VLLLRNSDIRRDEQVDLRDIFEQLDGNGSGILPHHADIHATNPDGGADQGGWNDWHRNECLFRHRTIGLLLLHTGHVAAIMSEPVGPLAHSFAYSLYFNYH